MWFYLQQTVQQVEARLDGHELARVFAEDEEQAEDQSEYPMSTP
jgi:hypothetical protein